MTLEQVKAKAVLKDFDGYPGVFRLEPALQVMMGEKKVGLVGVKPEGNLGYYYEFPVGSAPQQISSLDNFSWLQ